jgi:proteasome lid subunit RPN8/RPN11
MEVIRLTTAVYNSMVQHARAMLPSEAVGLLGGLMSDYATYSIPLPNRAGPYTFLADPFAQFQAERELAHLGLRLLAIYHSHPDGSAQLSQLDFVFARKRACFQIVIALHRPYLSGEEVRAYRVVENEAMTVEISVDRN